MKACLCYDKIPNGTDKQSIMNSRALLRTNLVKYPITEGTAQHRGTKPVKMTPFGRNRLLSVSPKDEHERERVLSIDLLILRNFVGNIFQLPRKLGPGMNKVLVAIIE